MQFLAEEHGEDALDLMRELKHAFDPNNILNPGKVVPPYLEGGHSS
jgi:D-lactate dehydrogenase (cytochrome)